MAKKKLKSKKSKDSGSPRDGVRGAVEGTFLRAAGGVQELLDEVSTAVTRLREANVIETLEGLRDEIQSLAKRVNALELRGGSDSRPAKATARRATTTRTAAARKPAARRPAAAKRTTAAKPAASSGTSSTAAAKTPAARKTATTRKPASTTRKPATPRKPASTTRKPAAPRKPAATRKPPASGSSS